MGQDKILKKLEEHDTKLDQINAKLIDHDQRFDDHDKRFADHDKRFDKLIKWNFRIENDIKKLEIKIDQSTDKILSAVDSFAHQVKEVKTEQVFQGKVVSRHETDIRKIKKVLKVT